jgi:uncharacterized LabA/DUF88 family protein
MSEEIALFIDFDNIRFSMLNIQRHEPDPQELIAAARRYGTIMVARAYADWSRQPETFKGSLTAAMIDRVDCPVKLRQRIRIGSAYEGNAFTGGQNWSGNPPAESYPLHRYGTTTANTGPLPDNSAQENLQRDEQVSDKTDTLAEDLQHPPDQQHTQSSHNQSFPMATTALQESDTDPLEDSFTTRRSTEHLSAIPGESSNATNHHTADLPSLGRHTTAHLPGISAATTSTLVQSTVDLNMVMDIIETVFDRPSISTFVLMTGDKDFTRICARLKLRLNKTVIIVGVPGTVSRDLISSASQFVPLVPLSNTADTPSSVTGELSSAGDIENISTRAMPAIGYSETNQLGEGSSDPLSMPIIDPLDPLFLQFLDYIDRNWPLRTTSSIAHFLGDPFNPKNRFRGRFTRESARELLHICIHEKILLVHTGVTGIPELYLNRAHSDVSETLKHF